MPNLHAQIQATEARIVKLQAELGPPQERREWMGEEWWEAIESAAVLDELRDIFQAQQTLMDHLQDTIDEQRGPWVELHAGVFGATDILLPAASLLEMRRRIHQAFNPQGEYPKTWAAEEKQWQRQFEATRKSSAKAEHQWKGVEI